MQEAQKDVHFASHSTEAETPTPSAKKKRPTKDDSLGSISAKKPRQLFTPTPHSKLKLEKSESENGSGNESDADSMGEIDKEDRDIFQGRFGLEAAPEAKEDSGKDDPAGAATKEEPKEDSEEQHEQDEEKPSNLPSDSWDGLDAETRAVLEKVKPDLLDQLPCSSSPKLS